MNRREFAASTLGALILPVVRPWVSLARPVSSHLPTTLPSIANIIRVSFEPAKVAALHGNTWTDRALNLATYRGDIQLCPLGAVATKPNPTGGYVTYPIEELSIPVTWSDEDEKLNQTASSRVTLAASLIENALWSHDDLLLQQLEGHRLIVSEEYHYTRGEIAYTPPHVYDDGQFWHGYHVFHVYTAFARVPR